jgi:hypothetical protein
VIFDFAPRKGKLLKVIYIILNGQIKNINRKITIVYELRLRVALHGGGDGRGPEAGPNMLIYLCFHSCVISRPEAVLRRGRVFAGRGEIC